jgi:hypothetical protein
VVQQRWLTTPAYVPGASLRLKEQCNRAAILRPTPGPKRETALVATQLEYGPGATIDPRFAGGPGPCITSMRLFRRARHFRGADMTDLADELDDTVRHEWGNADHADADFYLSQGLHDNVEMDRYIRDPAPEPSLSKGLIETLLTRTPAHARLEHPRLNPALIDDSSSRSDIGSAVHAKCLGGKEITIIDADDWRTKSAQTARNEAREAGRIALLRKDASNLSRIADAVFEKCERAGMALDDAIHEQTAVWQDGEIWCRARPDSLWVDEKICGDIKTTKNADPYSWIKSTLFGSSYHIQTSHYTRGIERIRNERGWRFRFIVVEIDEPFCVSIVGVDPAVIDLADRMCAKARSIWAACMRDSRWPGYGDGIAVAELPAYIDFEWESRNAAMTVGSDYVSI